MYKNILLILTAGLGDFVEAITVFEAIRNEYPKARIVLLCSDRIYSYIRHCPYCDEVIPWSVSKGSAFVLYKILSYLKIALYLRKYKFDVTVNFYEIGSRKGSFLLRTLLKTISPKMTLGRNTNGLGDFFDLKIEDNDRLQKNQSYYYLELAKLIGIKQVKKFPIFWFTKNEFETNFVIPEGKLIAGLGVGSDRKSRLWEEESFASVINFLRDKYKAYVVLLGGKNEIGIAKKIISFSGEKDVLDLTGKTDIEGLIRVISKCDIVISVNSSPMHIAANLRIPVIGLIGPGNLYRDMPNGDESKIFLVWKDIGCNPCDRYECPSNRKCMIEIKPVEVANLVNQVLQK